MQRSRRVFIVGGTGFLGYHTAREFLAKGWGVTVLGLPPAPPADLFPASVKVIIRDLEQLPDGELLALLRGHEVLVYAAGLDDRYTPRKPAYPAFHHANVEVPVRVLRLAQQAGVRRVVVMGSYFAHFNRLWPELKLAEQHPYIRSRIEQEETLLSIPGLDVDVLELPYIFGGIPVPGWRPLWKPLVSYLRSAGTIFYMKGGTACIAVETVGRAVVGVVEHGLASTCYPIGGENLTWTEMLTRLAAADGRQVQVIPLPRWVVQLGMWGVSLVHWLQGKESGLDLRHFASLQTAETYLDPQPSQGALGYESADLRDAFRQTVEACK